jgi:hypothetical protein
MHDDAKTGDPTHCLTYCGKILVEVCEVITVEARTEDLAYLLAGVRLGRINDPVRRSDISRRVNRIQKALGRPEET